MKITALDIRQKTFEKSFRGIDKEEVQAFLTMLSQQWERLGDENRELRLKLEHAQQDVQKLREVESSLYRTLKTAEDTGASITEQAQREADLRRREAQLAAEHTLAEARQQARALVEEAHQTAERTVADMQQQVLGLGQECQRVEQQLDTLVGDLHHLASEALEKAERARARPKNGPAAILSRAASVQVRRPAAAPNPAAPMPVFDAAAALPAAYNPKPGQQPEPSRDPFAPDVERPTAPAENPGVAPAPRIDQPAPDRVPEPFVPPATPPSYPEIAPIGPGGPGGPEIGPPSPAPYPGSRQAPAEVGAERSFFDEI